MYIFPWKDSVYVAAYAKIDEVFMLKFKLFMLEDKSLMLENKLFMLKTTCFCERIIFYEAVVWRKDEVLQDKKLKQRKSIYVERWSTMRDER